MSLNESHVEEAALEWFGEQSRFARTLTRPLTSAISAALRFPWGEEKRDASRRLTPAIPEEARELSFAESETIEPQDTHE